jgi:hypothetical protein
MKKLSISLFAIVVAVFAISSAFTTAKTTSTERWHLLQTPTSVGNFEEIFDELGTYVSGAVENAQEPSIFECDQEVELVCAVKILDDDENGTIEVLDEAEVPQSYPESGYIIFKSEQ